MQLREALEAIADKEEAVKEMERRVRLERQEKDELLRENQVRFIIAPAPHVRLFSTLSFLTPGCSFRGS